MVPRSDDESNQPSVIDTEDIQKAENDDLIDNAEENTSEPEEETATEE